MLLFNKDTLTLKTITNEYIKCSNISNIKNVIGSPITNFILTTKNIININDTSTYINHHIDTRNRINNTTEIKTITLNELANGTLHIIFKHNILIFYMRIGRNDRYMTIKNSKKKLTNVHNYKIIRNNIIVGFMDGSSCVYTYTRNVDSVSYCNVIEYIETHMDVPFDEIMYFSLMTIILYDGKKYKILKNNINIDTTILDNIDIRHLWYNNNYGLYVVIDKMYNIYNYYLHNYKLEKRNMTHNLKSFKYNYFSYENETIGAFYNDNVEYMSLNDYNTYTIDKSYDMIIFGKDIIINRFNPENYNMYDQKNKHIIQTILLCNKCLTLTKIPKYLLYNVLSYIIQF
jgi:hypothetical protein